MEMTIIMGGLIIILFGVVELANMLNQYINLVDGAREGARFGSQDDPFAPVDPGEPNFYEKMVLIVEGNDILGYKSAIDPLVLDPNVDDLVISFFSIEQANGNVTRFPDADGWSEYGNKSSAFTTAQIGQKLDAAAPSTGVLLVELFYTYKQILNFFPSNLTKVHAYSIMPLSAAEPTPTP